MADLDSPISPRRTTAIAAANCADNLLDSPVEAG